MAKFLVLVSFLISFSAAADVYSGRSLKCDMIAGPAPAQTYSVRVSVHETQPAVGIIDVMLLSPSQDKNVGPFSMILKPIDQLKTSTTVTAMGHGKTIVISTIGSTLNARLVDTQWQQVFECHE